MYIYKSTYHFLILIFLYSVGFYIYKSQWNRDYGFNKNKIYINLFAPSLEQRRSVWSNIK